MSDNRPKDICHECDKVDDHMTMKYVNEESTHDDRLICEECEKPQPNKQYRLVGKTGEKSIARGNTWAESEIK